MVLRIAVASFSHETCTFCPNATTLEAWETGGIRYGADALETEGEGKGRGGPGPWGWGAGSPPRPST
jgi:hypothetical protein